ncbi:hypothetical protein DASC09_040970 [Saccharomycopsis crataegensis]|uniref:Proteasome assembly chaperone 4 n=1 Tax=Saccharomycopsis crataegensis TaxID=43959 RepID=A0AAV5QQL4_9ASCO|nr:hypothetical protein DASC09_040970 [Saccharomycopsis crataegensis]
MSTTTFHQEISPQFFGDPIKVSITYPSTPPSPSARNKVPITVFLSKTGGNTPLGAYVYSVYDFKKNHQVYTTTLNSSNEDTLDFTIRLSKLLSTRFQCPSYVSASGLISLEESTAYIKQVMDLIKEKYDIK